MVVNKVVSAIDVGIYLLLTSAVGTSETRDADLSVIDLSASMPIPKLDRRTELPSDAM